MADEFNNPLGVIMGFVEDMLGNAKPDHPDHRSLEMVYGEARRSSSKPVASSRKLR